ncbi:MAG: hypothetical protein Q9227_007300 [Pyrenula ochraceoflavens]
MSGVYGQLFFEEIVDKWHILTSIGVYQYMVLAEAIDMASKGQKIRLEKAGPNLLFTPIVVSQPRRKNSEPLVPHQPLETLDVVARK